MARAKSTSISFLYFLPLGFFMRDTYEPTLRHLFSRQQDCHTKVNRIVQKKAGQTGVHTFLSV